MPRRNTLTKLAAPLLRQIIETIESINWTNPGSLAYSRTISLPKARAAVTGDALIYTVMAGVLFVR